MIDKIASSIIASGTGIGHTLTRRSLDAGKKTSETEEIIVKKNLEDERKKVQPIYNIRGKIVKLKEDHIIPCPEYNNKGKDVKPRRNYIYITA